MKIPAHTGYMFRVETEGMHIKSITLQEFCMSYILLTLSFFACGSKDTDTAQEDTQIDEPSTEDTSAEDTASEDTAVDPQEPLSVVGIWEDNYTTTIEITQTEMSDSWGSTYTITDYNNDERWLVAQNGANNAYNPNLWSKFEWFVDSEIYYCQTAYDAADAESAIAAMSDQSDKDAGCNGFPWSIIREQITIKGVYNDNWGTQHTVNSFTWMFGDDSFALTTLNNEEGWATAKNSIENAYFPDLWSKFEWFVDSDTIYYCQSAYDKETEEAAASVNSDRSNTETGCGGFSWSILTIIE